MATRFKNSRSRLERAATHARSFCAEWDAIFDNDGLRPVFGKEKNSGWWVLSAEFSPASAARVDSNNLSLELGELAYQLRAALDGLIWETITIQQHGMEPPTDAANGLDFPILNGKNRDFQTRALHKFPFPQRLKEWLESIQPDATEKPFDNPDRGLKTTLEDIHDLARMDRHRRLRIIGAYPRSATLFEVDTLPPGGRIVSHEWIDCDLFGGQRELVRIRVECPGGLSPYTVRLKAKVAFDMSVEDVELHEGKNISFQLERFLQAVGRVIDKFDAELS